MSRKGSFVSRPLDWIFSAPSHAPLLRALKDSAEGMSGRAAARAAGLNHQACKQALDRLEALGVVRRRGSGRTQLLSLDFDNALVRGALLPLFRAEKEFQAELRGAVKRALGKDASIAVLFGSVARGKDRPGSDLDVLLVARGGAKARLSDRALDLGRSFTAKYGIRLSPLTYTAAEVRARYRAGDPLLKNVLEQGIDLLDEKLKDAVL